MFNSDADADPDIDFDPDTNSLTLILHVVGTIQEGAADPHSVALKLKRRLAAFGDRVKTQFFSEIFESDELPLQRGHSPGGEWLDHPVR